MMDLLCLDAKALVEALKTMCGGRWSRVKVIFQHGYLQMPRARCHVYQYILDAYD